MDEAHLEQLCLGAEEVTGHPNLVDLKMERRAGINGAVTMETRSRRREEEEEERWRKLYPDIKKCVIMITRQRLHPLKVKQDGRRKEEAESDWMQPLELDERDNKVSSTSFVKKVEVRVQQNHDEDSGPLRLLQSPDDNTDPAFCRRRRHHHISNGLQIKGVREGSKRLTCSKKETNADIRQSDNEHNYSVVNKNTPEEPNDQCKDASSTSVLGRQDGNLSPTEEKNRATIVFRKVGSDQWALKSSKVMKEEQDAENMEEEEEDSAVNSDQKRRRKACGKCVACLRKDCGKCIFCLDKRKFGGPEKKKQRCRFRVCLVVMTRSKARPAPVDTLEVEEERGTMEYMTTKPPHWRRGRRDKELKVIGMWGRRWGRNPTARRWMNREEEKNGQKKIESATQEEKRKRRWWIKRWRKKNRKRKLADGGWMKEEGPKKETHQPQFLQLALVDEAGQLLPEGPPTGTYIQLNLTLDSSHFIPSILSDPTLTINNQSGQLPQDCSVHHESLCFPPPPPLLLQPKEEEEVVEVTRRWVEDRLRDDGGSTEVSSGWTEEVPVQMEEAPGQTKEEPGHVEDPPGGMEETCTDEVTDRGRYFQVEVQVEQCDSDEETQMATYPQITEIAEDVTRPDSAYKRPEFISLSFLDSFSLLGNDLSDDVTCGQDLFKLLRVLRRTVLPPHWVPVLADGPLLQLLQCSKLSAMADTVVHIQPDQLFYVTVQNRQLPDTHALHRTHTQRITHLNQLVSLLLDLERLIVCRGLRVRAPAGLLEVRSPSCYLLVAPPCRTCVPCLLQEEDEEEDEDEVSENDL